MTTVSVTGTTQTVVVADTAGTAIVTVPSPSTIVSVDRVGPQGPQGPPGPAGLIVDQSAKVDQSIVYYDAGSGTFKADPTWTTTTIVDGANF